MNNAYFNFSEFTFPSSDGIHDIHAVLYTPCGKHPRGVVQIVHGMTDHIGRYAELARFLLERGFAVSGHDQLGHGKTAKDASELGFFAPCGGTEFVIDDVLSMNKILHERFEGIPIIIFGHSMGSFIVRIFASRYPSLIDGIVLHGTGGPKKIVSLGLVFVKLLSLFKGKRHRSPVMRSVAFCGYNSKFPKTEGKNAWLTRDTFKAEEKLGDVYANYTFTLSGYSDLFRFVKTASSKECISKFPKNVPTLVISGTDDPVGGFGKGVMLLCKRLLRAGHTALKYKLYEGARHELFGETNRREVFSDLYSWLLEVTG